VVADVDDLAAIALEHQLLQRHRPPSCAGPPGSPKGQRRAGGVLLRPLASAVIAAVIVALVIVLPQRVGRHPGHPDGSGAETRSHGAEAWRPAQDSGDPDT
jgi:hypothetical protein